MTEGPEIETVPVIEETATLTTHRTLTGRVRVAIRTEETEDLLPAEISTEEVEVTRIPHDRRIEAMPEIVTRDGLTIIPVVEERLVVTRELYLTEEIHIRRITRREQVGLPVKTRRQIADIERSSAHPETAPARRTTDMTYESDTMRTTSVSALFDSPVDAERAVDRLIAAGIPAERIHQTPGRSDDTPVVAEKERGFWDSLADFFFPEEDRYAYAEGLSRGGYLVTVTGVTGADYDTALDILDEEGSVDLDERTETWRAEGWRGYDAAALAMPPAAEAVDRAVDRAYDDRVGLTSDEVTAEAGFSGGLSSDLSREGRSFDEDETIPVVEERLRVGKRQTENGRVRVRAYVVEEPVSESVDLRSEHVEIERRPVDRPLTDADAAFRDRTIEAEEYREEAVIAKEARVVEEIGLKKTSETRRETVSDTIRRTEVEIENDRDGILRDKTRDDLAREKL